MVCLFEDNSLSILSFPGDDHSDGGVLEMLCTPGEAGPMWIKSIGTQWCLVAYPVYAYVIKFLNSYSMALRRRSDIVFFRSLPPFSLSVHLVCLTLLQHSLFCTAIVLN